MNILQNWIANSHRNDWILRRFSNRGPLVPEICTLVSHGQQEVIIMLAQRQHSKRNFYSKNNYIHSIV